MFSIHSSITPPRWLDFQMHDYRRAPPILRRTGGTGTITLMKAFLAAVLVAISIVLICTIAEVVGWNFVKAYQTLLAAAVALVAAVFAYQGAISNARAVAAAADKQIAAMREQREYDNTIATARMMKNRASLLFAIAAELRAINHAIERRRYVEYISEILSFLKQGKDISLIEIKITKNYTPIIDAASTKIGEFSPEIARSIAKIGILLKSTIEQTNSIYEAAQKPAAHLIPIENRALMTSILLQDLVELINEIKSTTPVLESHAEEINKSIPK